MWYALGSDSQSVTTGPLANDASLVSAANANHVQIWPTVDGGLEKTVIQALIHDASKRATHIQNLVNLATSNGYSGLDLDYEHLWGAGDRPDFSTFASELGAAMHAAGLQASMAITAIMAPDGAYDHDALVGSLDVIHIMGYDLHGMGGPHIGPGDPLDWIKAVEHYATLTGFPMRFILGVPNFGFTLTDSCLGTDCAPKCTGSISTTDSEFMNCIFNDGNPKWQSGRSPNCPTQNGQQYFEDVASLEERVASAKADGLAGVTYWSMGNEPPGLFDMFERYYPVAGSGAPRPHPGTDVNSDGKGDFLARDASGNWQVWTSDGTRFVNTATFTSNYSDASGFNAPGRILAMDLNGDGRTDFAARHVDGSFSTWISNGTVLVATTDFATALTDASGWSSGFRFF